MSLWNRITGLVRDPPPGYLFELSEAGIAFSCRGERGFEPFDAGVLVVSPVEDNIRNPDTIAAALERIAPRNGSKNGSKKRRPAALILPDYAARVTVLDFDSFPSAPEEQLSLVRFRVKKTIPFEIDSAAVAYGVQPSGNHKKIEVVAVTVALEVVARYEALFRNAGFHPGVVTTSALAALNLYRGDGVVVLAKLSGLTLTAMVLSGNAIKLFRCVTLEEASDDEILAVLHPTFAYVEDELGSPARKLILCGFPNGAPPGMDCEVEPLHSRLAPPGPFDAGLLGYWEAVES
jgi:type IV pilus assembly protein PilM